MGRPQLIGRATEEMSQTADGRNLGKLAGLERQATDGNPSPGPEARLVQEDNQQQQKTEPITHHRPAGDHVIVEGTKGHRDPQPQ